MVAHRSWPPLSNYCKEERTYKLSEFEIKETLGVGPCCRVRLVHHIEDKVHYALKIVKKKYVLDMELVEHFKREVRLLSLVHHPFIVKLHAHFQDELRLYLLMEFVAGGELYALLRDRGRSLPSNQAIYYSGEVILAIEHLHSLHILYRGLKPENVLLNRGGHVKLVDFGFAKVVPERTYTVCGTPDYIAPEVLTNMGYGKSVDWWALGVLIFEMLVGRAPFSDKTPFGIYEKISLGKFYLPRSLDTKTKDLLRKLLQIDRTKRLGCRNGSNDIKAHAWYHGIDWDALFNKQCKTPHRPMLAGDADTRYFDRYPDSEPGPEEPLDGEGLELFRDFS